MTPYQSSELHVYSRALEADFRDRGAVFDKKMLRHNDTVAVGQHYANLGPVTGRTFRTAKDGVREAVLACVKVWVLDKGPALEPMYVEGRGPLTMISPWMEDWR